jgi:D-xylose 1-dehydrogenase (NADP+, D-xylono-1,5-lactone-forming)
MTALKHESELVNWGVLGAARVAEKVLVPGIQRSGNGRVYAVASRTPEKASQFAKKVGARVAYGSYEELLRDDLVQAVYVALPNSLHKEWTIRAAEAGKHVLCEKPMATRYADAVEMVDACRRNGVLLMEAFAHRFHPQNVAVKRIVDEGGIGEPTGFVAVHSSSLPEQGDIRLNKELDGGALADKGCYCVNTARLMMGTEPTSVFARGQYLDGDGVDVRLTVELGFPGGRVAQLDTGLVLKGDAYYQSYTVLGEDARIWVPVGFAQRETYRQGIIVDSSYHIARSAGLGLAIERVDVPGVHQWQLEAQYFADRVLKSESIRYPAENGLGNAKVMDAIYRSAREQREVRL